MAEFERIEVRPGVRLAIDARKPKNARLPHPGFMWLGGFKSDMTGTKATSLLQMALPAGRRFIRFDYSGHGQSDGRFEDGTISLWLDEALKVLEIAEDWPMILIGSSMGGYLTLLLAQKRIENIKGIVLIAPATDMTQELMRREISADPEALQAFERDGVWLRPSAYGEPYPITRKLIEDGRKHLLFPSGIDLDIPVRILHGENDADVPWQHGLRTFGAIRASDAQFTLIKGGDHRLSRDEDIMAIYRAAESLAINFAVKDETPRPEGLPDRSDR